MDKHFEKGSQQYKFKPIFFLAKCESGNQVIQLADIACRNCDLVGGKAASLAYMMALKDQGNVSYACPKYYKFSPICFYYSNTI